MLRREEEKDRVREQERDLERIREKMREKEREKEKQGNITLPSINLDHIETKYRTIIL